MAEIAARSGEGFRQLRWLDLVWRLEKQRGQHQRLEKSEAVGREHARGERLETARRAIDGEHGTFPEKSVDTHGVQKVVEGLNYSK